MDECFFYLMLLRFYQTNHQCCRVYYKCVYFALRRQFGWPFQSANRSQHFTTLATLGRHTSLVAQAAREVPPCSAIPSCSHTLMDGFLDLFVSRCNYGITSSSTFATLLSSFTCIRSATPRLFPPQLSQRLNHQPSN